MVDLFGQRLDGLLEELERGFVACCGQGAGYSSDSMLCLAAELIGLDH